MVKDEEPDGSNLILRQLECPSDQTRDFLVPRVVETFNLIALTGFFSNG